MNNILKTKKDIDDITMLLVEKGLCDNQNPAIIINTGKESAKIEWSGHKDLSICLKNLEYKDIYNEINRSKEYSLKLADGNIIQFLYTFENDTIISHRLAMFPSPSLETFQNERELYESDCIYADILNKNIVTVPIRFDYISKDIPLHPYSHASFGQYKNCRIPVFGPISPKIFIKFILKNFYNSFYEEKVKGALDETIERTYTIRPFEKNELHFNLV